MKRLSTMWEFIKNIFYSSYNLTAMMWWKLERGVSNLSYYFGVIWNDRDCDHSFFESLMLKKLKRQYKSAVKSTPYENLDTNIKAMRICITVLERRKNNFYIDGWYSKEAHKQKSIFVPVPQGLTFNSDLTEE